MFGFIHKILSSIEIFSIQHKNICSQVPNSPWFVEVKDPNTPLLAPMLVASKGTKNGQTGSRHGSTSDLTAANNYANKINSELKQVS